MKRILSEIRQYLYKNVCISSTIPNLQNTLMWHDWCAQGSPQSIIDVTFEENINRSMIPKCLLCQLDSESAVHFDVAVLGAPLDWCAQGCPQSIKNVTCKKNINRNMIPKCLCFKYDSESVLHFNVTKLNDFKNYFSSIGMITLLTPVINERL